MKAILLAVLLACSARGQSAMAFTVSWEKPAAHLLHVAFTCEGLHGETQDFILPAWAPGYYRLMDYQKYVSNFRPHDGSGRPLPWQKVTRNSWRVATANAARVTVEYDVFANSTFGVQNFLNEDRAYLSPPALFLYVAGQLQHPVTVTLALPPGWRQIATGLEPVAGRPDTFTAPDFDFLFDCPTLLGNQESLEFQARGVPHYVALEKVPASVDRERMLGDLKRIVEAATGLMGDIPYRHYTFLMMGTGNGGIEHLNSASISFSGASLTTENGYRAWLSYVAHEYFHNFNVKRIRPIALGPFDYEAENLTSMLWVSEGLSVYYQDLLLVRAGLITRRQYLEKMQSSIEKFENAGGHHYQSAVDSSLHTWGNSGVGLDRNTTISYYDNGAMLGAMLDLKIRRESRNRQSLDDVMRSLYRKFYQEKKRGFTDAEFRQECEAAAGAPLDEVFEYASTPRDVDYARYFAYAGLALTETRQAAPGAYLGLYTETVEGRLIVSATSEQSPAQKAGLRPGDEVLEVEGAAATPKALNDQLTARQAGDRLKLRISRAGTAWEAQPVLSAGVKRSFRLQPADGANSTETEIGNSWLAGR